jgi:hypothetical protein
MRDEDVLTVYHVSRLTASKLPDDVKWDLEIYRKEVSDALVEYSTADFVIQCRMLCVTVIGKGNGESA